MLEYMIINILFSCDDSVICVVLEYLNQLDRYAAWSLSLKYLDILLGYEMIDQESKNSC